METQAHINDRLQFEQHQLADALKRIEARLEKLEAVAPPLPDEYKARMDFLVTTMNEFRETAMKMLIEMAEAHKPPTPVAEVPVELVVPPTETPIPDISVGWVGGERRG